MFFILDTADRLGFTKVLSDIKPSSPQGQKMKKAIRPFLPGDEEKFTQMSKGLEHWLYLGKNTEILDNLKPLLVKLKSINGILERLAKRESLNEGECFEIKSNLLITRKIYDILTATIMMEIFICDNSLYDLTFHIDPIEQLWQLLNPGELETERFYLMDEYDQDLARIRKEKNELQKMIRNMKKEAVKDLEAKLGRTIPSSGEVMVSLGDQEIIDYIKTCDDLKLERETFSAYFYKWIPGPAILNTQDQLKRIELDEEQITLRVLKELSLKISQYLDPLQLNQERLGELDWMLAKIKHAIKNQCVLPQLIVKNQIKIEGGRHLLVEAEVHRREDTYTPINLTLEKGVAVITGSNMGGKTLNLRMVGLLTAMAQYGLCVSADNMEFSLREFIYFSVDDDQTKGDLSTFGQEIVGLNQALYLKEKPGLYLIDELARGTNPKEGEALGKAIIKYLLISPAITVLTTHFAALAQISEVKHWRVVGLNQERYEELKNMHWDNISLNMINQLMDYHLVEVANENGVPRDAIRVASLLGLDEKIVKDAETIIKG